MGRDRRVDIEEILQSCEVVQHFTQNRDRDTIQQDSHLVDVVMHNVEIIGEASNRVRTKFHQDIRDDDWEALRAIPDAMAEGHAEDTDAVWKIIEEVIPSVHDRVRFYLV